MKHLGALEIWRALSAQAGGAILPRFERASDKKDILQQLREARQLRHLEQIQDTGDASSPSP